MNRSDDELVSSVLDGEATAAERAHVEADPALRTRLAEFRGVHDAVAAAPVPDDLAALARERALAAFLAEQPALDAAPVAIVEDPPRAPVITLATRRTRTHARRGVAVLGAAAAVLVALIGFGALRQGGSGDGGDDAAGAFAEADTALGDRAATSAQSSGPAAATANDAGGANPREAAALADLGAVGDLDALQAAWRASTAARGSAASSAGTTGAPTAPSASSDALRCSPVVGRATLAGRPVLLVAGGATISVVEATTCALIGTFPS